VRSCLICSIQTGFLAADLHPALRPMHRIAQIGLAALLALAMSAAAVAEAPTSAAVAAADSADSCMMVHGIDNIWSCGDDRRPTFMVQADEHIHPAGNVIG
jgi:hypothetical protein